MKKFVLGGLKILIPLTCGLLLLGYVYRDTQWGELLETLGKGTQWEWLVATFGIDIFSHYLRAKRWKMLTDQVKEGISTWTLFNAVMFGYGVNLIFPRLGEVSRCVAVAKKEKTPFVTIFGTLLSERLIDILFMCVVAVFTIGLQFNYFKNNLGQYRDALNPFLSHSHYILGGVVLIVLLGIYLFSYKKENKFIISLRKFLSNLWEGMKTLFRIERKTYFSVLTLMLWGAYFLQMYFCQLAFDFTSHLSFLVVLVLYTMGTLSYALPVQGAVGAWHFAIILSLKFYGVAEGDAKLFALVAHAVPTLAMAVGGLWAFVWFAYQSRHSPSPQ